MPPHSNMSNIVNDFLLHMSQGVLSVCSTLYPFKSCLNPGNNRHRWTKSAPAPNRGIIRWKLKYQDDICDYDFSGFSGKFSIFTSTPFYFFCRLSFVASGYVFAKLYDLTNKNHTTNRKRDINDDDDDDEDGMVVGQSLNMGMSTVRKDFVRKRHVLCDFAEAADKKRANRRHPERVAWEQVNCATSIQGYPFTWRKRGLGFMLERNSPGGSFHWMELKFILFAEVVYGCISGVKLLLEKSISCYFEQTWFAWGGRGNLWADSLNVRAITWKYYFIVE